MKNVKIYNEYEELIPPTSVEDMAIELEKQEQILKKQQAEIGQLYNELYANLIQMLRESLYSQPQNMSLIYYVHDKLLELTSNIECGNY